MTADFVAWFVFALALLFAYSIGFQDVSSIITSALSVRAMHARQAILLVAVFEFLGAVFGGSAVASTVVSIADWPQGMKLHVVLASALSAAILWNLFARRAGIPSSSTHAIVGGIIGSLVAASGFSALKWGGWQSLSTHPTGLLMIILSLFLSPLLGGLGGFIALKVVTGLLKNARSRWNRYMNRMQWILLPVLAFGHGSIDTQKLNAIVVLALFATGIDSGEHIPVWCKLIMAMSIALGVYTSAPRVIKRLTGIFKQRPIHSITAASTSAAVVMGGSVVGAPLCTTQVIASGIIGVGSAERIKGVHWKACGYILKAWLFTIPATATIGYLTCLAALSTGLVP